VIKLSIRLTGSGRISAQRLIEEIIALAKERGIDQATLAADAGISAESLSRLKKAGGCRLATALDLARAAGFGSIQLTKQAIDKVAASMVARKLSAGRRLPISAEELVLALQSDASQAEFRAHLCGFFEEDVDVVADSMIELDCEACSAPERPLKTCPHLIESWKSQFKQRPPCRRRPFP
jgi:DNA-binding phage protein